MPDYGQRATDREYERVRKRVNEIYRRAYVDIKRKGEDFVEKHKARDAKYRQAVKDGTMSQADYDAWLRGQIFQGKEWAAKKRQMADTLYHADVAAQKIVNDARFDVFAQNANYIGYNLEHTKGINTGFGLYDANAVKRLVKDEPDLLPPKKVNEWKAYKWYNRQVNNAVTQGIIQGESVDKIALRIGKQTNETNMSAMLRNARTSFTGAQNAGRIEGLHQAQELGIKVQKQWIATLDDRTRDTHAELDGQTVDVDEPFVTSEGNEIMYPGDPSADPSEVWNCRCTLVYVYPDYPSGMEQSDRDSNKIKDMGFNDWVKSKK